MTYNYNYNNKLISVDEFISTNEKNNKCLECGAKNDEHYYYCSLWNPNNNIIKLNKDMIIDNNHNIIEKEIIQKDIIETINISDKNNNESTFIELNHEFTFIELDDTYILIS